MGRKLRLLACIASLALAGTATAGGRIKIVDEGAIKDAWMLAPGVKLAVPPYPQAYATNKADVCVAIGYLLKEDGTTSEFSMLKSWSAAGRPASDDEYWSTFAGHASAALSQWRFAPKPDVAKPEPVYTVATFLFSEKPTAGLRDQCAISGLAMHIFELQQDPRMKRKMARGIFAQLETDPLMEQRYWAQRRADEQATQKPVLPPPPSNSGSQQPRPNPRPNS